jgi:hypothetical protein
MAIGIVVASQLATRLFPIATQVLDDLLLAQLDCEQDRRRHASVGGFCADRQGIACASSIWSSV